MASAEPVALSVVIPTHNGRALLAACLPALKADLADLRVGSEVIVVDDRSRDGTIDWLGREFPAVRTLPHEAPPGYGAACNAGARAAKGTAVAFLNNDAEPRPGWAQALLGALHCDRDTVIAGGLTLFRDQPDTVNSAGIRVAISGGASDIGFGSRLSRLALSPGEVAAVSGVGFVADRDWFLSSGGFDEELFMYFEDVDLCLRAWLAGKRVRFTPEAVLLHRGGATSGTRHGPLRAYYGSRNRLLVAGKAVDRLAVAVALMLAQDMVTVLWLGLSQGPATAIEGARHRARGCAAALRALPRVRRERRRRAAHRARTFRDLRAAGIVEPLTASIREFARLRAFDRGLAQSP